MNDKEILAGAPEGATHYDVCTSTYWHNSSGGYYLICSDGTKTCNAVIGKSRSLADIRALIEKDERIKELENYIDIALDNSKEQLIARIAELESTSNSRANSINEMSHMIAGLQNQLAELEKERDARDLEKMALGIKASIDFWHRNTSNKMQGHIDYGILGKRPIDNPDSIPVDILERDMNALTEQAKQLREGVNIIQGGDK